MDTVCMHLFVSNIYMQNSFQLCSNSEATGTALKHSMLCLKLHWCITRTAEPLWSTNQKCCGVKCLPISVSTYTADCLHTPFLLTGNTGPLPVPLWPCESTFGLPTHPHPTPPTYPLIYNTHDITGAVKNYLINQQ